MKGLNFFKKLSQLRFAAGFAVVGLIISIIAGIGIANPDTGTYETVNAVITNIEEHQLDDEIKHTVYVKYSVDGKEYESQLDAYQSDWKVGSVVECEYDVDNPEYIRNGDGTLVTFVVFALGVAAFAFGTFKLVQGFKTPSDDFAQYDRVKAEQIDVRAAERIKNSNEPKEEFVFHYTGKLNQSYIMKDKFGKPIYEAVCDGITLVKDTEYEFKNHLTGASSVKKIGHTVTGSYGGNFLGSTVKSAFKINGQNCWDVIASMGYGFEFGLNGIKSHFEVKHMGVNIGYAELAGTGLMIEKYKDNPLGKIPTNGIFKISCPRSEVEGMFFICFALSKTEFTVS